MIQYRPVAVARWRSGKGRLPAATGPVRDLSDDGVGWQPGSNPCVASESLWVVVPRAEQKTSPQGALSVKWFLDTSFCTFVPSLSVISACVRPFGDDHLVVVLERG